MNYHHRGRNDDQLFHALISALIEWVQVVTKCASEHDWILRDHRDLVPEASDSNFLNVDVIDFDRAGLQLDNSCQSHADSGLACTCAAHNTNLFARTG